MTWLINPVFAVFIGGGLGSLMRFWITLKIQNGQLAFPLATLLSNLLGALIIGVVFALVTQTALISANTKLFLMTGLCGGLTTFSTFSLEMFTLIQKSQWTLLITTLFCNVVLTVIVVSCAFYFTNKFLIK